MSATHLGFFNTSSSRTRVRFTFTTHAAAGGNVAPNSAFEAADLRIYKAADSAALSATQRSSAAGITMTSPFDSLTGVHAVDINLTDNTDAGFYATGCYYEVMLCPDETVDGQTITGVTLAAFEIGYPITAADTAAAVLSLAASTPIKADAVAVSGDAGAADNLETMLDGTGGQSLIATFVGNQTGNLSGSVGSVAGNVSGSVGSVTNSGQVKKGVAFPNFHFLLTDSTNHNPVTGKTITASIVKDSGTFGALNSGGAVTEIGFGMYRVPLSATDTNCDIFTLRFTAAGSDDAFERTIITV